MVNKFSVDCRQHCEQYVFSTTQYGILLSKVKNCVDFCFSKVKSDVESMLQEYDGRPL